MLLVLLLCILGILLLCPFIIPCFRYFLELLQAMMQDEFDWDEGIQLGIAICAMLGVFCLFGALIAYSRLPH